MGDTGDIDRRLAEQSERVARLEERMETKQAEYRTDIARLAEDMAKRDTRLLLWVIAVVGLGIAVIGILPNLPAIFGW